MVAVSKDKVLLKTLFSTFLSGVLSVAVFLSTLLTPFAPLPILVTWVLYGRVFALLSLLCAMALLGSFGTSTVLISYCLGVIPVALIGPELLMRWKISVDRTISAIFALTLGITATLLLFVWKVKGLDIFLLGAGFLDSVVAQLGQLPSDSLNQVFGTTQLEEIRSKIVMELPWVVFTSTLLVAWLNILGLLRLNPGGVVEKKGIDVSVLMNWRAPAHLVWLVIVSGALMLKDLGTATTIALNVFKFLMSIYALQGLSVLSFFLNAFKFSSVARAVSFVLGIFVMMPVVLGLGFFDLWFDFRSKIKPASQ